MQKRWMVAERKDPSMEVTLQSFFGDRPVHPAIVRILSARGVASVEDVAAFFDPSWERGVHDPFLFSQMHAAVDRIFTAIKNGERITVHGDYDADGVSGSAVLITTLRYLENRLSSSAKAGDLASWPVGPDSRLHGNDSLIDSYIPHRDKEGYGLHSATVVELQQRGTNLIITVDCGIACVKEIAEAKALGIDTIVVDHHQFGETLPDGILIHPKIPGETYPFPHLAAVGVAFKVACALVTDARTRGIDIPEGWEKWLLDFVSIATVTDMVPMVGENRVLETYGLKVMNRTKRPGLKKLIELAGCELGKITSESIGFSIGPRINAAGRMDHASLALAVLLAESDEDAAILSKELEDRNKDRQKATKGMMEEAETQLVEADSKIVVLWSEQWSPSLVGLVAGKYLDRTGKPTVAIGKHGERWVGSGRSFASYDITEAMRRAGEGILTHVGGHVQACGFSFSDSEKFDALVERLRQDAMKHLATEELAPILPIDAELSLDDVNWQLVENLLAMEPFGEGNKRPIFVTRNLVVIDSGLVGSTQSHVRCTLRSASGAVRKFIAFKFADRFDLFTVGNMIDVVYDVGINEWNGRRDIQCKVVDVRAS